MRVIALVLALFLVCIFTPSMTYSASKPAEQIYEGFVVIQGNEPFTVPVFITAYGSFAIEGPLRNELASPRYQQRKIRVRGEVLTRLSRQIPNTPVLIVLDIIGDI